MTTAHTGMKPRNNSSGWPRAKWSRVRAMISSFDRVSASAWPKTAGKRAAMTDQRETRWLAEQSCKHWRAPGSNIYLWKAASSKENETFWKELAEKNLKFQNLLGWWVPWFASEFRRVVKLVRETLWNNCRLVYRRLSSGSKSTQESDAKFNLERSH